MEELACTSIRHDLPLNQRDSQRLAEKVGGTLSYLVTDLLNNVVMAVSSSGTATAVELYEPYGQINYSWGTMPTAHNYTGQRLDSQNGLLYYNFRWYDPFTGRFVRADTIQGNLTGMDSYAYVSDNPEGMGDPTGHDGISLWGWDIPLPDIGIPALAAPEIVVPVILVVGVIWVGSNVIYHNIINPPKLGCGCIDPNSSSGASTGTGSGSAAGSATGFFSSALLAALAAAAAKAISGTTTTTTTGTTTTGSGSGPGISPFSLLAGAVAGVAATMAAFGKKPRSDTYNQVEKKIFEEAVRRIERTIGRRLTKDERRELHHVITDMKYPIDEIVAIGESMFRDRSPGWNR